MPNQPSSVTLFSYQVGFGDCFLLRFAYPDRDRHVLIDFGTTKLPDTAPKDQMLRIANDIADKCGGKLDAIVATHRHADHISGFATNADGNASGDVINGLNPDLVVQPWTEAPDEALDGLGPEISSPERGIGQKIAALQAMHAVAETAVAMLSGNALKNMSEEAREQIDFIGRDNVKNLSAVENLMAMGKAGKAVYAWHGSECGLEALLPGVKATVLGPPTLRQSDEIRKMASKNPDEFWQFSLTALRLDDSLATENEDDRLFPGHPVFPSTRLPMEAIGLCHRVDRARSSQMLSIVTALDDQMNNTSLILLFETGGRKLLFPGDAQIENWNYALHRVPELLDDVDLYKVGHHGSRNATPRTMWNRFDKRSDHEGPDRLKSVMSTLPGKHGSTKAHTEVPRETLVEELKARSELHSTHLLPPEQLCERIDIPLA